MAETFGNKCFIVSEAFLNLTEELFCFADVRLLRETYVPRAVKPET